MDLQHLLKLVCLLLFSQCVFTAPRIDGNVPLDDEDAEAYTPEVKEGEEDKEDLMEPATTFTPRILVPPASAGLNQDQLQKGPHAKPMQATKKVYRGTVKIWPKSFPDKSNFDITEATALCYDNQFDLVLHLAAPFKGYIYPYHHFKQCHLLTGEGERAVSLRVNQDSCGMDVSHGVEEGVLSFVQYTMMLQWDKDVIGKWDRKIQVTCNRDDTDHRSVEFAPDDPPSNPDLYLQIETESEDESDDGESDVYDLAKVGETVDVTVSLLSSTDSYDAHVLNCSAYDGLRKNHLTIGTYTGNSTSETTYDGLKVLYKDGCPTDKKWLAPFEKTKTGFKTMLASNLKIFRFPSSGIVIISCDVQVCKGECPEFTCPATKLEEDKTAPAEPTMKVTLFRPIMVRLGSGILSDHVHHEELHTAQGVPTASFVAGLIGMGFVCAIVCVFMYRRFKKGSEKDYKMQYNVEKNKDEVAPLKVTTGTPAE